MSKTSIDGVRAYASLSMWRTDLVTVEYDAKLNQVSIFHGNAYLVYPLEAWLKITQAVEQVLPADLAAGQELSA